MQRRRRGFTTRWTVAGDAAARTITLPLVNSGGATYSCTVNWGDGTYSTITAYDDANRIHTYAADGTYDVEIRGVCEGWSFNNGGDKLKITKVLFWGDRPVFAGFKYLTAAFFGCSNNASPGYRSYRPSGTGPTNLAALYYSNRITVIPDWSLRYATAVTDLSYVYYNNLITAIPKDNLRYATLATNLTAIYAANLLTAIPEDNMRYVTAATNMTSAYSNNHQLTLNANIFYRDGEQATRFLGKTMNFTSCFQRSGAFTGAQGVAPDLWNCDYGETITLDVAPAVDWAGGDTITGQSSGATAVVVAKVSALVYKIKKHFGTFTLGEVIGVTGVADKLADQGAANPTFAGKPTSTGCFSGHSIATVSNYADIPAAWK